MKLITKKWYLLAGNFLFLKSSTELIFDHITHHNWPENLKKSIPKTREIKSINFTKKFFLTKFHFLQFQI